MTLTAIAFTAAAGALVVGSGLLVLGARAYQRRSHAIDRTLTARQGMRQFFFDERERPTVSSEELDTLWRQYTAVSFQAHLAAELDGDDPINLYPPLFASLYRAWTRDRERALVRYHDSQCVRLDEPRGDEDWSANAM